MVSEELYRNIYNVPDPDNEYAELLYARGYLISDEPYVVKSDWASMSFGEGLCITYDNRCEVAYVVRDTTWVLILGTVMDTIENHMDAERVAAKIAEKYAAGEDELYDYIDYLGGRHIIVYGQGEQAYLLQDATGMRSACYHRERLLVASHYNIIQNIVHAERSEFVKTYCEMENRPWLLPGNTTPYEDIMILMPNHRLSLTSLQMKRFFPRKPHLHVDVNEAMDYIADCCARQMEVLSQNRKLMFSITKGNDARITLASTKGKTDDHVFYTYFGQNDPSQMSDYNFVREFAKKHHLNHIGVPCEFPYDNAQWEQLQDVCYHNHYHFHLFWSIPNLQKMLPTDRLVVRSNLVEIIRADFYSDLPAGSDWKKLAQRLYPTQIDNPVYRDIMKRFFEECEYDKNLRLSYR